MEQQRADGLQLTPTNFKERAEERVAYAFVDRKRVDGPWRRIFIVRYKSARLGDTVNLFDVDGWDIDEDDTPHGRQQVSVPSPDEHLGFLVQWQHGYYSCEHSEMLKTFED